MTVSFQEFDDSPKITFSTEGVTAERRLVCAWADYKDLVTELMGQGYAFTGVGRAVFPGLAWVIADKVDVSPWIEKADYQPSFTDVSIDLNTFYGSDEAPGKALLRVSNKLIDFQSAEEEGDEDENGQPVPNVEDGTYLEYHREETGEFELVSPYEVRWETGTDCAVPPGMETRLRIPITDHVMTWRRVFSPPWSAIRNLKGKVNAALWCGFPAETLMFVGAKGVRVFSGFDAIGDPRLCWALEYTFKERNIGDGHYGWNHRWRTTYTNTHPAGWDRLLFNQATKIYETGSFAVLFIQGGS